MNENANHCPRGRSILIQRPGIFEEIPTPWVRQESGIMAQEYLRHDMGATYSQKEPLQDLQSAPFLPDPNGQPVVVSKFSGWGSLLNLFPLLSGLRNRYPDSSLILLTDRRNKDLAKHLKFFDRILYLETSRKSALLPVMDLLKICATLRQLSPSLFLDLQLHSRKRLSSFLALASGARIRVGFADSRDKMRFWPLTHSLYFNNLQPIRRAFDQVTRLLDLPSSPSVSLHLHGGNKDQEALYEHLPELRSPRTVLCTINPNASEMSFERRWPLEKFREVCQRLHDGDHSRIIVLTGTREERSYVETLLKGLSPRMLGQFRNLAGQLSFESLAALLKRSDLFISNDSGPLHLALFLGTPTVGLFGPTHPGLIPFSDPSHKSVFLYLPLYCSPCVHQTPTPPCGGNNLCMQAITADAVIRASESLLDRKHRSAAHLPQAFSPSEYSQNELSRDFPVALFRSDVLHFSSKISWETLPLAPSRIQDG